MIRCIYIIVALLMSQNLYGQINLVPNPSFEDTVACPDHGGNIDQAEGWINCGLTPDYYNSCANNTFPSLGVPDGLYNGFQYANDGNAYAGFYTMTIPHTGREFIAISLLQPLISGVKYFVSCYISKSEFHDCAINNFGFRFFTNLIFSTSNPAPIDNFAHVYSDSIIADTSNWVKIYGSFLSDSAYQYLVLGNFFNNQNTNLSNCDTNNVDAVYYLVDAVCVSQDSIYCGTWLGINEYQTNKIKIYPNPTESLIKIINMDGSIYFDIYNLLGSKVMNGYTDDKTINVSNLTYGLYTLLLNRQHVIKIIIIK